MKKAIAKATTLANAAGIELGRIVDVSEQNRGIPRARAMAKSFAAEDASAASVPIASGENSYSVTVNVRWELKQ